MCPHPCYTIPKTDIFRHSEAEEIFELHFFKDMSSRVGKRAEDLWEARQKSQRQSEKAQRISATDREKVTSELTVNGRRGCLSELHPHPCLVQEGTQPQQRPPGTAPLSGSSPCQLSSPLAFSSLGLILGKWMLQVWDAVGCGGCRGTSVLPPCHAGVDVQGTTRSLAQLQSPSDTGRFPMLGGI